jgi:hypothetical protein
MLSLLSTKGISKTMDGIMTKVDGMKGPCESGHMDQLYAFSKDIKQSAAK